MDALFAPPRKQADEERMRDAHHRAARTLLVGGASGPEAWGWQGRTIGRRCGDRWLRVVSRPLEKPAGRLWDGAAAADTQLPRTIPRPRVVDVLEWTAGGHRYRAELTELVPWPVIQTGGPVLTDDPALPQVWWTELTAALAAMSSVPTERQAVRQQWIDKNFDTYLGIPPVQVTAWTTGHGDLHWANLCAEHLVVLDWESWGTLPVGYDAGLLHAYSLRAPATARRVRTTFAHILDTPAGRTGELVALAQLLQVIARGHHQEIAEAISARAELLTGRPVPRRSA